VPERYAISVRQTDSESRSGDTFFTARVIPSGHFRSFLAESPGVYRDCQSRSCDIAPLSDASQR
jgi:hypothetical protein